MSLIINMIYVNLQGNIDIAIFSSNLKYFKIHEVNRIIRFESNFLWDI